MRARRHARTWGTALLAVIWLLASLQGGGAQAADGLKIVIDGQPAVFEAAPVEQGGVVCVPMKGVFARLGAVVNYDGVTRKVKALRGKTLILLTLGSDVATVNLKPYKLQVAPFLAGGVIMVPLRFVGEAFGAAVSYDATTHVVSIKSGKEAVITLPTVRIPPAASPSPGGPSPSPSPTPMGAQITEFSHNATATLHPGDTLRVTMVATPRGQASFSIPGLVDKAPLTEGPEGTYAIDFPLPATASVQAAPVYGVLVVGTERAPLATAPLPLTVAPRVPHVEKPVPVPGAQVSEKTPRISGFFEMLGGTLDLASVRLTVNGSDVTRQAHVTREFFAYTPPQPLSGTVKVEVSGKVTPTGSAASVDWSDAWSFSIQGSAVRVQSVSHGPADVYKTGDLLEVTMIGTAGGAARFDIGTLKRGVEMREASPGTYAGSYRVQAADRIDAATIVAYLRVAGDEASAQAPVPVTLGVGPVVTGELPLTVSSPAPETPFGKGVPVRGQTAPGARVRVEVMRRLPLVDRDVRVSGGEGTADAQGIYSVDAPLPWLMKGARLTLVVTASDPSGKRAGPVTVPVIGK